MNIVVKADVADAYALPLEQLNPAKAERFQSGSMWPYFERLRREDPVHFTPESEFGPYWSITKWEDIMAVDTNHEAFTSTEGIGLGTIESREQMEKVMGGRSAEMQREAARRGDGSFIGLDAPHHAPKRKAVSPTLAPSNLEKMAPQVRERAGEILDSLPIGVEFDWVDKVSMELTAMTLAALFDFPFEQRRKLTYWSDMFMNNPGHGGVESWEQKVAAIYECRATFDEMWKQRIDAEPGIDLISMLAHNPATRNMSNDEYQGNVAVLIIGGNDTTRNTISGSIYELNRNPDQYVKLRANPDLVTPMVSETIRKGDRVVMWYISGNRDETVIENPNSYVIDRSRPRQHMSFGFGVHRCVGNRVAEMQLTIIWEEILKRFPEIRVVGEPTRTYSSFVHGFETLPVVIPARA